MDYISDGILKYLRNEEDIPDLAYIQDGTCFLMRSKRETISYSIPRNDLFPLERYRLPHGKKSPFSCITTNYGSPYHCGFCISQNLSFHSRKIPEIIDELKYLESIGIKEVFIKGFTFGVDRLLTLELCLQCKKMFP